MISTAMWLQGSELFEGQKRMIQRQDLPEVSLSAQKGGVAERMSGGCHYVWGEK